MQIRLLLDGVSGKVLILSQAYISNYRACELSRNLYGILKPVSVE